MNTNSNSYTIAYASVMVIIVAFLLAFVSSALKEKQDANVRIDKKKQILAALNIREVQDAEKSYSEVVVADMVINAKGDTIQTGESKDQHGFTVENKSITADNLPIYICEIDGQKKYVVPMSGRGLWGGLWGYVAINEDCSTVYGAYFSHESETAGLGSPIAEEKFQSQFQGKKIFADDSDENVDLTIVKKGKVVNPDVEVDGLTGATLTTVGAANMVTEGLQRYVGFFNANKQ